MTASPTASTDPAADRAAAARTARLGDVAGIADWYEQVRIVVAADGPGVRTVRVAGDLATGTAAYLDVVLEHQVATRPARIVVDLSAVSFLGVRGVAALLRGADRAAGATVPFRLEIGGRADLARALARAGGPGAGTRPTRRTRGHDLEPHLGSPRRARALLRRACADWQLAGYDDAALVVTELVMNAVRHARTACRLDIDLDQRGLHIAVRDGGPLRPALLEPSLRCGADLRLVATLAERWGVVPHDDGKTVWALFPPRPPSHPTSAAG